MEEAKGVFACLLFDSTLKTVLEGAGNEGLFIQMIEFLLPGKHIASIVRANKEKHGLVLSEKVVIIASFLHLKFTLSIKIFAYIFILSINIYIFAMNSHMKWTRRY